MTIAAAVVEIYDVLHIQQGDDKQEVAKSVYDKLAKRKVRVPAVFFSELRNVAFATRDQPTG